MGVGEGAAAGQEALCLVVEASCVFLARQAPIQLRFFFSCCLQRASQKVKKEQ